MNGPLNKRSVWIDNSYPDELATMPDCPYRLCYSTGERFGLSTLDAIRSQKSGILYRPEGIGNLPGEVVELHQEGGQS